MKNFPVDVMRASQLGPIVGVDVTAGRSITADDVARPSTVWRWLWSGQWRRGPPIVSLLMRAATVSTARDVTAARDATDLLVLPEVAKVEIRDFSAYRSRPWPRAIAPPWRRWMKLDRPVQGLRRRLSLAEQAASEGRTETAAYAAGLSIAARVNRPHIEGPVQQLKGGDPVSHSNGLSAVAATWTSASGVCA